MTDGCRLSLVKILVSKEFGCHFYIFMPINHRLVPIFRRNIQTQLTIDYSSLVMLPRAIRWLPNILFVLLRKIILVPLQL